MTDQPQHTLTTAVSAGMQEAKRANRMFERSMALCELITQTAESLPDQQRDEVLAKLRKILSDTQ